MDLLLVTVDTNQLDAARLDRLAKGLHVPYELAYITVTGRERGDGPQVTMRCVPETAVWGESRWGEAVWGGPIAEVFVPGKSRLDEAVVGGDTHVDVFEDALTIIGDGSFPPRGNRDGLTKGQHRQLRDAMIFEAHVRAGRHVLVTEDAQGFVRDGRQGKLQELGRTWVLTPDQLEALASEGRLEALVEPPTER